MSARVEAGDCPKCGKRRELLAPLHGERGGPMWCINCGMDWHGKHGRIRKLGRIVIKAMALYEKAGGKLYGPDGLDALRLAAGGISVASWDGIDAIGAEIGDITSELLRDTLQLVHPDHHPPERKELAQRVTQELVALKPFVFPAPKPDPEPIIKPPMRDASTESSSDNLKDWLREKYPCEDCSNEVPYHYCDPCKAEYEKREKEKRERERAKQRKWYKRRKEISEWRKPDFTCICGKKFKPKRPDSKHCSAACRQKAYRQKKDGRVIEDQPNRWRTQWVQERDRKVRIRTKWKKIWSLPKGSKVVVNGAGSKKYPRGTRLEINGWWGWKICLKAEGDEERQFGDDFSSREIDAYDIVPLDEKFNGHTQA